MKNFAKMFFTMALIMCCAMSASAGKKVLLSMDFEDGQAIGGWGNNSIRQVENGVLKISNPSVVNSWEAQMAYDFDDAFLPNCEYTLTMKVKGSASGQISVGFQNTENSYISVGEFGAADFTTEWRSVTLKCICNGEGGTRFTFSFGQFAGDIYIDDLELSVYTNDIVSDMAVRVSLQDVEFNMYEGWGVDAKKTGTTVPIWEMGVPTYCPYGDTSVSNGADLSAYSKMFVTVSPDSEGMRIMMNRKIQEGQCSDIEETSNLISIPSHSWCTQKYCTQEGNTYIIDLAKILKDQGFVRLHAIKGASYNTTATIESIELVRVVDSMDDLDNLLTVKRQYLLSYADSLGTLGYTALKAELQTLIGDGSSVENTLEAKRAELLRLNEMNSIGEGVFVLPQLVADGDALSNIKSFTPLTETLTAAKAVLENKATATSDNLVKAYNELAAACQTWHVRFDNIDSWNFYNSVTIGDFEVQLDVNNKMANIYRYHGASANLVIPDMITYNGENYSVVGIGRGKSNNDWNSDAICDSLTSVILPETLRFIGRYAFNGCSELDSLEVPAYVTWIGQGAFSGTSLNELRVKAIVPPVCENSISPVYIVYVPDGCGNAYWDADYWKECAIVPGEGINLFITLQEPGTLGELILEQTEYLRNVNSLKISGNVNEADMQIIGRLQGLISVDMSELTMKSLPGRLFEGRKALTSVKLPTTLETIGENAFYGCVHLYTIELPNTLKRIESNAFHSSAIENIELPEGLNYIGGWAFYLCDNLKEVTIPAGIRTIENYAFYTCNNLKKVVCQEGLEYIGQYAFGYCYNLESVTLPSTLKRCDEAFHECQNMEQIICYAMLPPACNEKYIVTGVDECALYVPEWTINKYKLAAGWTEFYPIKPIGVLPEDITVYQDFKLTLPDSIPTGYKPNLTIENGGYDMYDNMVTDFQLEGNASLALKSFQMNYGYYYSERWNGNYYYWDHYYNGSQLLNNVEGVKADKVTMQLSIPTGRWSFITMPFDVKVSDIVPTDGTTRWIIRRYAGDLRAKQDFANAWQNLTADSILRAGEGYIWHCAGNNYSNETRSFILQALANANMNNLFATDTLKVDLGHYPAELAHNQGWNLVGNPFPTHYDSRALGFSAPITVWDGSTYVAYSIMDDDYVLMPGEAFFVQSAGENEQVAFPAVGRQLHDSVRVNPSYAPQVVTRAAAAPRRVFNVVLAGEGQTDRTRFVINPTAQNGYELNCDASKFMSDNADVPQLYTIEGEANLAINERPLGEGVIVLGARFGQSGNYTLSLNTSVADMSVILVDLQTGIETDLCTAEYTFAAEAGTVADRFLVKLNTRSGATGLIHTLAQSTKVQALAGQVTVSTIEGTEVSLYTADGKLMQVATGAKVAFDVPAGFYVVKVQNLVYKVAVIR